MTSKKINPVIPVAVFLVCMVVVAIFVFGFVGNSSDASDQVQFKHQDESDSATGDTSVETLKTLTAEVTAVKQQNENLQKENEHLKNKNKTEFDALKEQLNDEITNQMAQVKSSNHLNQEEAIRAIETKHSNANYPIADSHNNQEHRFIWVSDQQSGSSKSSTSSQETNKTFSNQVVSLLNPSSNDQHSTISDNAISQNKIIATPYYTLPVNATLTGAVLMQPLIGRIPIDNKVPDPYRFKVIIGSKNLAANGIDIPSNIRGIVASGIATGDMLGSCVRGKITSMTFVFHDGRISTSEAKQDESLGLISASDGNPCIAGTFHTNAPEYLAGTAVLAGAQGYGSAISQAEIQNIISPDTGATTSTIIGNANKYALGHGLNTASQAVMNWWNQRIKNSFDFVFVPNVDTKTGKLVTININMTKQIAIDYNPLKRRVSYEHSESSYADSHMD